jgi:hypothetical protein
MRYLDLGLLTFFFLLIPWLTYRLGAHTGNGGESDEHHRRRSHGT